MHLEFYGAAGEVTGSCHVLEVRGRRVLLDCGLIQGGAAHSERNRAPFPFDAAQVDAVVLSHAHIDHCGRLPLLRRRGFRGPVFATSACRDLLFHVQEHNLSLEEIGGFLEEQGLAFIGFEVAEPRMCPASRNVSSSPGTTCTLRP